MEKLVKKGEEGISFYDCAEKDFFICAIGYNDFNFVEPIKAAYPRNTYTIHIVLGGSGTLCIGDKVYEVKERSLFFTAPDVSIAYYPDEDNLWDYVWFGFTGENSEIYAQKMGLSQQNPVTKIKDFGAVYSELHSIFGRLESTGTAGYYDVMASFYRILDINSAERKDTPQELCGIAEMYLECHYRSPSFSVENMCRALNVSHSHLCREYKKKNGETIISRLVKMRINEACTLLSSSMLSVSEIAYSAGFRDSVHFMKTFRKHMDMSPSEYRKNTKI